MRGIRLVAAVARPLADFRFDREDIGRIASEARVHLVGLFFEGHNHPQARLVQSFEIASHDTFFAENRVLRKMHEVMKNRAKSRCPVKDNHIDEGNARQMRGVGNHACAAGANGFVKRRVGNRLAGLRGIRDPRAIEDLFGEKWTQLEFLLLVERETQRKKVCALLVQPGKGLLHKVGEFFRGELARFHATLPKQTQRYLGVPWLHLSTRWRRMVARRSSLHVRQFCSVKLLRTFDIESDILTMS